MKIAQYCELQWQQQQQKCSSAGRFFRRRQMCSQCQNISKYNGKLCNKLELRICSPNGSCTRSCCDAIIKIENASFMQPAERAAIRKDSWIPYTGIWLIKIVYLGQVRVTRIIKLSESFKKILVQSFLYIGQNRVLSYLNSSFRHRLKGIWHSSSLLTKAFLLVIVGAVVSGLGAT